MELDKRNADTIELRKESNKTFLELQNKLELRTTQLSAVQEKYDRLEQVFKEVEKESNELRDKLTGQAQDEIDYRVHLEAQLNAQKAFVQAHKGKLRGRKCLVSPPLFVTYKFSIFSIPIMEVQFFIGTFSYQVFNNLSVYSSTPLVKTECLINSNQSIQLCPQHNLRNGP